MVTREKIKANKHSGMLVRALQYTHLHEREKDPLTVVQIADKFGESTMTTYKLIRLGKAPKEVHAMIYKGEVTATEVVNEIRKDMCDKQIITIASRLAQKRSQKEKKIEAAGFEGSSMTLRRKIGVAISNIKRKRILKTKDQYKMMDLLKELLENPSIEHIERSIVEA